MQSTTRQFQSAPAHSTPETRLEHALYGLRSLGVHLILLKPPEQFQYPVYLGSDFDAAAGWIPAWDGYKTRKPGSGQVIDHLRSYGGDPRSIGWKPMSRRLVVVDVDRGDAQRVIECRMPLAALPTRRERGFHLVYTLPSVRIVDGAAWEHEGAGGELKTDEVVRFHGDGAQRLLSALVHADGQDCPMPLAVFGEPRRVTVKPERKPRRVPFLEEACIGERNVSLFEYGRHLAYRLSAATHRGLERQCSSLASELNDCIAVPLPAAEAEKIGRSWARYIWGVRTGEWVGGWRCNVGRQSPPSVAQKPCSPAVPPPGGVISTTGDTSDPDPVSRVAGKGRGFSTPGQRTWGGITRGERIREANRDRDERMWVLHDAGKSVRAIASLKWTPGRNATHKVIKRKPEGQGEIDCFLRRHARVLLKRGGRAHLGAIKKAVEKRFGKKLSTGVVREWLALEPGPDYLREHEAREAARAARRPRVPVPPEIAAVRRTLRTFQGTTIELVVVAHPELWTTRRAMVESEYAKARRWWRRAA